MKKRGNGFFEKMSRTAFDAVGGPVLLIFGLGNWLLMAAIAAFIIYLVVDRLRAIAKEKKNKEK